MSISLTRQRIYLWRKFRGITTKRALAKALRTRLANMSRAEYRRYRSSPTKAGLKAKERLERCHLRERTMLVAILGKMYAKEVIFMNGGKHQATEPLLLDFETLRPVAPRTPQKSSRGPKWVQTSFYRRYS